MDLCPTSYVCICSLSKGASQIIVAAAKPSKILLFTLLLLLVIDLPTSFTSLPRLIPLIPSYLLKTLGVCRLIFFTLIGRQMSIVY